MSMQPSRGRRPPRQGHRPRPVSAPAAMPRAGSRTAASRVNGRRCSTPAFNVTDKDKIKVDGEPLAARQGTRVWLYHKPAGLVVTEKDPEGRPTVFDSLAAKDLPRVVSIGRLDINTEGLLLLTNDGGLKRVLELPATGWLRRYRVRAFGAVTQAQLDKLKDGIDDRGHPVRPDRSHARARAGLQCLARRWACAKARTARSRTSSARSASQVNRLIRVSYGPFQLGDLADGRRRRGHAPACCASSSASASPPRPTSISRARCPSRRRRRSRPPTRRCAPPRRARRSRGFAAQARSVPLRGRRRGRRAAARRTPASAIAPAASTSRPATEAPRAARERSTAEDGNPLRRMAAPTRRRPRRDGDEPASADVPRIGPSAATSRTGPSPASEARPEAGDARGERRASAPSKRPKRSFDRPAPAAGRQVPPEPRARRPPARRAVNAPRATPAIVPPAPARTPEVRGSARPTRQGPTAPSARERADRGPRRPRTSALTAPIRRRAPSRRQVAVRCGGDPPRAASATGRPVRRAGRGDRPRAAAPVRPATSPARPRPSARRRWRASPAAARRRPATARRPAGGAPRGPAEAARLSHAHRRRQIPRQGAAVAVR